MAIATQTLTEVPPEELEIGDVMVEISALFGLIQFLDPSTPEWGWRHPTMTAWMERYGFRAVHELTDQALITILISLRDRHKFLKQQQPKIIENHV